ncbi:Response regulator of zinc sigma-54-dependent two-component system [Acidisarcina polymorpha]|uniref:Response regulator of zinc sigma-54-dependent two-component system n=2 Tax=Acidisarcina polymorpha TaxID=2211140 RepID=A0A2Z5FVR9_9BACT|nr:sigma-54 dependent transcriptional regulator [Acidisarcina polymorpha]AXC10840.1 Response regulator of zinc sigma-54-dependent two-component system [Acidisarcina polymorpha]
MPTFARPAEKLGGMYILIVDEDLAVRTACCEIANHLGYVSHGVSGTAEARAILHNNSVDILLLDLKGPSEEGLSLMEEVKAMHPETAVVVMTAFATVPSAVEAMRTGANDLLTKPFASDELGTVLERAAERRTLDLASRGLRERLRTQQGLGNIIGRSSEMEKLYRILAKVAQSTHPALILGESGTGKELVARAIHANGPNAAKPFIPVDCGSLVPTLIESELFGHVKGAFTGANRSKEGLLASAGDGTVFLDEIGELPLDLQARLLRALQEKEVRPVGATHGIPIHARVLAATNRDLSQMVEQGRFRKDLYYRLNVVNLRVPPLRERRADIPLLAAHFLDRLGRENGVTYTLSDEALRMMVEYQWPGNVRELEHAIQRGATVSSGPLLQLGDLSTRLVEFSLNLRRTIQPSSRSLFRSSGNAAGIEERSSGSAGQIVPLAIQERQAILSTLDTLKGDKLMAAKVLGIGKTTLYRKLKEYGISEQPAMP